MGTLKVLGPSPAEAQSAGKVYRIGVLSPFPGVRDAKRKLDADERALTRRVIDALTLHGLPALRAERAVATVGTRTDLTVDPARFVEAVGLPAAAPALRVLVEKARLVLGGETLSAMGNRGRKLIQ